MKIILTEDVPRLGVRGAVVEVADGYARNYLIPKKLAIPATPSNLKSWQELQRVQQEKMQRKRLQAERMANKISKTLLVFKVKAGEEGKLFGSISSIDILNALKERKIPVEKGMIRMEEPIRRLGTYRVPIRLHPEVETTVKVEVVPEEGPEGG